MTLFDHLVRLAVPLAPRFLVRRVARRYVAGERLEDALAEVTRLNDEGAAATIDVLGEEVTEPARAGEAVDAYLRLLAAITEHKLDCNLSVKPSLMGLRISEQLCLENTGRLARAAAERGVFLRLDMEDHTTTDQTLALYRKLQPETGNLGVVLQSMLHRTNADIAALTGERVNVRLVKGIYREPRRVAWRAFETVRAAFEYHLEKLLSAGAYVGIATHDEHLVWAGLRAVDRLGLTRDQYEFQMLLGVEPELRRILLDQGHRLRVYVPYGRDWYAYAVRRLRENPTIAWHVLRALLRPGRYRS